MKKILLSSLLLSFILLTGFMTYEINYKENAMSYENRASEDAYLIARETVKTECATDIWNSWDTAEQESKTLKDNTIGLARPLVLGTEMPDNKMYYYIDLHIRDTLVNQEQITHTAWHECAHAKTYIMEESIEYKELSNKAQTLFKDGEHSWKEYLADAMATVKTGSNEKNYYQNDFTPEQLELSKEIWDTIGIVGHKTQIHTGEQQ